MSSRRIFNFAASEAPSAPLAWLALVAGALLLAVAADRYAGAATETESLVRQEERLKRKAGAEAPEKVRQAASEKSAPAGRREAAVFPWDILLREVELAADSRVAFLALDTDAAQRRSRIGAEARSIEDALAFAGRLGESPLASRVLLLSHEMKKNHAVPVVGFSLQVDWNLE